MGLANTGLPKCRFFLPEAAALSGSTAARPGHLLLAPVNNNY
jgi:hypothetical protein